MTPRSREGTLVVRRGDSEFRVQVEPDGRVRVAPGGAVEVLRLSADTYRVTAGDRSWHVVVLARGDHRQAFVDGAVVELEIGQPTARRRSSRADALEAPMPARVRAIKVEVGQVVTAGEVLMTLEAMKMELAVRAPRDGRVATIACREGEMVLQGVPLLQLE